MLTVSSYGSIPSSTIWIPSAGKVGQIWKAEMKSGESMVKPTETTPLPDHTVAVLESDEPFAPEIW